MILGALGGGGAHRFSVLAFSRFGCAKLKLKDGRVQAAALPLRPHFRIDPVYTFLHTIRHQRARVECDALDAIKMNDPTAAPAAVLSPESESVLLRDRDKLDEYKNVDRQTTGVITPFTINTETGVLGKDL